MIYNSRQVVSLRVSINGSLVDSILSASIVTTNYFSADIFSLTLALDPASGLTMDYWSETPSLYIEIGDSTLDDSTPTGLITGRADSVSIDPIRRTISIHGRDLSSSLIDSYRQQEFINQTAGEVVAQIALSHKLIPVVTSTPERIGRYFGDGYTRLSLGQYSRHRSDWDLVVDLARENGFDAFVRDRSLFFQPSDPNGLPLIVLSVNDVTHLSIERALNIDPSRTVRVQSWDILKATVYESGPAGVAAVAANAALTEVQPYLFSAPNFTSGQVLSCAERYYAEINRLQTVLEFEMPWDQALAPRSRLVFHDLDVTAGSQFIIDSIERRYNTLSGSSQHVRAVFATP
jgi:hypothetical protein